MVEALEDRSLLSVAPVRDGGLAGIVRDVSVTIASASTTTLTSSPNPSVYSQSVGFTATVASVPPATGIPTGTVQFLDGSATLATVALNSSGTATLNRSSLTLGQHTIAAVYSGDTNFTGSTSAAITQTVLAATRTATPSSSANPSVYGQPVTLSTTVTAVAPGTGTPSGDVTFFDGDQTIDTVQLSSGSASLTIPFFITGEHDITAVYNGDADFNSSTSLAFAQLVNRARTTTTLTSSDNPSIPFEQVLFTARVSAVAPGGGAPQGTVSFYLGGASTPFSTQQLAAGMATAPFTFTAVGQYIVTAKYNLARQSNWGASQGSVQQTVHNPSVPQALTASPVAHRQAERSYAADLRGALDPASVSRREQTDSRQVRQLIAVNSIMAEWGRVGGDQEISRRAIHDFETIVARLDYGAMPGGIELLTL
jgi:hypothetical protein